MKKKILHITALLMSAVLLLAACGTGGQNGGSTPSGSAGQINADPAAQPSQSTAEAVTHLPDPEESRSENSGSLSVITDVKDGISQNGSVFTITAAGTYTFSGSADEGQIIVDAGEEKVEIILNGVTLKNSGDAPVKVLSADKVTLSAAEGSYNEITDARALRTEEEAEAEEKAAGGAVYAKCDLTLAGTGTLVVSGGYNNGVHTTKDLKIKELTLKVTAPNNALKGNDSVTVSSGSLILISTGGDGIKTEDSDVSSKGNQRGTVSISGGTVEIWAACDGIDASYDAEIGGEATVLNICTDTYSPYTGSTVGQSGTKAYLIVTPALDEAYTFFAYFYNDDRTDGRWEQASFEMNCYSGRTVYHALSYTAPAGYENTAFFAFGAQNAAVSLESYAAATSGGAVNRSLNAFFIKTADTDSRTLSGDYVSFSTSSGDSVSAKGIKADNEIRIDGGTVSIQSSDDAVHANNDVTLENGSNGLGDVTVNGGSLTLSSGDDGIHGDGTVTVNGGSIRIVKAYEGIEGNRIIFNDGTVSVYATDDGVNAKSGSQSPLIRVCGGYLEVATAAGDTDGIDSNGSYEQTGGFVLIRAGSQMGGMSGSLDTDGSVSVTGGTIVALGGICTTPSGGSNCCAVLMNGQSFAAGSYTVSDGSGTLISFTLDAGCTSGWIASDTLRTGGSYSLERDGSSVYSWSQSAQSVGSGSQQGAPGGWGRPGGGRR